MARKLYEELMMAVMPFEAEDVISTSGDPDCGKDNGGPCGNCNCQISQ